LIELFEDGCKVAFPQLDIEPKSGAATPIMAGHDTAGFVLCYCQLRPAKEGKYPYLQAGTAGAG
jgi:hypothetical protein